MLRDVPLAPGFPIRKVAERAGGKSGSDLKELCRNAVMMPVRELIHDANGDVTRLAKGQEEVRLRFSSASLSSNMLYHTGLQSSPSYV